MRFQSSSEQLQFRRAHERQRGDLLRWIGYDRFEQADIVLLHLPHGSFVKEVGVVFEIGMIAFSKRIMSTASS